MTRLVLVLVLGLGIALGNAAPAAAHPLGNFTTNRYARVEVGADVVRVHYVLDEAELVAFRQRDAIAAEGEPSYLERRVEEIRRGLRLRLDGALASLRVEETRLRQPTGQGGLTTLRIEAVFEAPLVGTSLTFEDTNTPNLLGWREIVAASAAGATLDGDAPTVDRTDGLRAYPTDPGVTPLDVRAVTFDFAPGAGEDRPASLDTRAGTARTDGSDDRLTRLLASTTSSPLTVASALLAAFGLGIVHALGPGHGKTVMAAYLVSTQGRRRDAFALGGVVSLMHTASVLALAGVLATFGRRLDASRLYPVLTIVAGLLVLAVGARLVRRRLRGSRAAAAHAHDLGHDDSPMVHVAAAVPPVALDGAEGGSIALLARPASARDHAVHDHGRHSDHVHGHHHHGHDGGHHHDHGPHGHTHELPADVKPLSRAGLVALGTSGGLFPSPSAVVVLVGAFALGRAALGLALIAAFSVGLAAMLVAVGLLLVAGRDRLDRSRFAVQLPWLPIAGAGAIVVLGGVLLVQGITQLR